MFDTRNVIEKLRNCNGFFTTHRYPPWLRFREDKQFSFNFRERREAFINTDTRRFEIQTSDMWPLPQRQSLSTKSHVLTHDNFAFRKGLIVSGLMHNSPRAMLVWTHEYVFTPFSPITHLCKKIEHVILFYLFNRIVLCLKHIILWFNIKGNILYKSKDSLFQFKLMFFVCLFNLLFSWFFDWWFIDWLARKRGLCMFVYVVKTTSILVMREFCFI